MPASLFPRTPRLRGRLLLAAATAAVAAVLTGCAATAPTAPASSPPPTFGHIHTVIPEDAGTLLVGTHTGLYRVEEDGTVDGPLGGYDFDLMGLAASGDALIASGHPGLDTPAELGSPNLGIIRSEDAGESWQPVAFTNTEDFHVLTAGPDGRLYGIGSTSPALRVSDDRGDTWEARGEVAAVDLAVTTDGTITAATPEGLRTSTDDGASFTSAADAPLLYLLEAAGDTVIGVGTDGQIWQRAGDTSWETIGSATGTVEAVGLSPTGMVILVDERGIVALDGDESTIILPALSGP
ncbi:sialidase family protein [Leucobacter sp. wl10]|uniref:WD40/YVTN/BNR-like repeat-containing protein n=1 Tax=Leucobacter sp. wl10 TaxID=2304677 RepID=UPI000E5A3EE8|nr:sialidase family protein [Leucobacter sp. wl10]RGE19052.1 exo-alpha-sialidase [Leucobacter sp. wl10]